MSFCLAVWEDKKCLTVLKIFLSSTFRDLSDERASLLRQIKKAFEPIGMEVFIPTGEPSQKRALDELLKSDVVIFLISSHYGSNIDTCVYKERCKADCSMKTGEEKISYTWCEYRFTRAEGKPHMSCIIDEGAWPSRDGAPTLWKFRDEIEKEEFCPRLKKDKWQRVVKDFVSNVVNWYQDNKLNFGCFCGRRKELKELFEKIESGCVEVYGVGGIGKTTLCELVLLFYNALGRKVRYIRREKAYSSGTGLRAANALNPKQFKGLSVDTVIDALDMPPEMKGYDTESKIESIISKLEKEGIILFIDDVQKGDNLNELIKKGNNLSKASILVASKKQLGIAHYRLPLSGNEAGEHLVRIMASRLGKSVSEDDISKIASIAEGHPVATYLLVSNLERAGIKTLQDFKGGLEFSRDEDVEEYVNRIFSSTLSEDTYKFLKGISVISSFDSIRAIEIELLNEMLSEEEVRAILGELIDANVIQREGNLLLWYLEQFQDAVFIKAGTEGYRLAHQYYQKRYARYGEKEDELKILICECKVEYEPVLYKRFQELYDSLEPAGAAYELLPVLAEEIIRHLEEKEEKAEAYFTLGNICWELSNYKDRAENCRRAIRAYEEALKVYTVKRFPMQYAMTQNNLGTAYRTLAEVEDKANNCKRAIRAYEEALKVYTLKRFPMDYAMTQNNLGIAYKTLAEVEDKANNCKKAIRAYEEALKIFTKEEFPENYPLVTSNLKKLMEFCGSNN